jgi:hypothetical protein
MQPTYFTQTGKDRSNGQTNYDLHILCPNLNILHNGPLEIRNAK